MIRCVVCNRSNKRNGALCKSCNDAWMLFWRERIEEGDSSTPTYEQVMGWAANRARRFVAQKKSSKAVIKARERLKQAFVKWDEEEIKKECAPWPKK